MPATESSSISRVSYNEDKSELTIVFRNSGVYNFREVPPGIYHALMAAPSKGRFFNEAVRGHFPSTCVRRFKPAWKRLAAAG